MFKDESGFKKIVNRLKIDTGPNPKHREELRRRVLSAFNEAGRRPETRIIDFKTIRRKIMKSPITKIGAAAVIIIAVLIGLYFLSDSVGITSTAYAEIVERLHKARTLTYVVETTTPIEGMPSISMEVAFKEPGYMRMAAPGGFVSIVDSIQGKCITILPPRKQFIEMEMSNLQKDPAQQNIDVIERLRSLPERADEELGTKEIEGRVVQGYRVTEEGLINTIWIDIQTRNLVLVEMEFLNAPGMSGTISDFQFDVELDDSLFSLTPPEGYTRMEIQVDTDEVSEQDMIEFLRLWTTWTKDGRFPPTLDPTELANLSMEMVKKGEFKESQTTEEENFQNSLQMTQGLMFLLKLPADSNWRYDGEDVKYGQADKAIFWYRPEGSETYRVIYGDLSVKDVAAENLPK
jgi:outer membrane lipoprotein-sorting protein